MSGALAEALVAAQRRAMQAVEKAYVAGALDREMADLELIAVGAADAVDRSALLDALDTLRRYGAPLPAEPKPNGDAEPAKATDAQVKYAQSLFQRGDLVPLAESDLRSLPRERISVLIEQLKAGTYDPSAWDVAVLVCACDRDSLCPTCAAREAAEWEPDTDAPPLDPEYLAL